MINTVTAIEAIKKVDDALGVIFKYIEKLKAQPDVAALKLAEALDEIGKTYLTVDNSITKFLRLGIDENALKQGSDLLLTMEGGGILVEVEKGKGHCHVIWNIYLKYLDKWFFKVLFGDDSKAMHQVFALLGDADMGLFENIAEIAKQIQQSAEEVLDKLYAGKEDEARKQIMEARKELQPVRFAMSAGLQSLYKLKGEFIKIGEIV